MALFRHAIVVAWQFVNSHVVPIDSLLYYFSSSLDSLGIIILPGDPLLSNYISLN